MMENRKKYLRRIMLVAMAFLLCTVCSMETKKCKSRLTSDRTRNKTYEERSDDQNIQIKSNRLSGLFIGIKAWQL